MKREGVTAWQPILYHDEPEEASADSRGLAVWFTERGAINAAKGNLTDYWQTASVYRGTWYPGQLGVRPDHFEYDEETTAIRVGKGWVEK